jgi:hypothetical protein
MASIMILTYCVLLGYFRVMGIQNAEINAIVPTLGFHLSTWSMSFVKLIWLRLTANKNANNEGGNEPPPQPF